MTAADVDRDLPCDECGRAFATAAELTEHLRDSHGHDPD